MKVQQPNFHQLQATLNHFSPRQRLGFSLGWCERAYPAYAEFAAGRETPDYLRRILDGLWAILLEEPENPHPSIADALSSCMGIPIGDDATSPHYWKAICAIDLTILTLETFNDKSCNLLVAIAKCGLGRVDQQLWRELTCHRKGAITPPQVDELNWQIECHPMMQAELAWQEQIVRFLTEHPVMDESVILLLRQLVNT